MRSLSIGIATFLACVLGGATLGAIVGSLEEDDTCFSGLAVIAGAIVYGGAGLLVGCAAAPIAAALDESVRSGRVSQTAPRAAQAVPLLRPARSAPCSLISPAEAPRPDSARTSARVPEAWETDQTKRPRSPSNWV